MIDLPPCTAVSVPVVVVALDPSIAWVFAKEIRVDASYGGGLVPDLRELEVGLVNHLHHTHKVPISTACDTLDLSKATYYREGAPTAPAIQAPISPWWKTLIRARWMRGTDSANPGYSVMLTYAEPLNMKPLS